MNFFLIELKKLWQLFRFDPKAILAGVIAPTAIIFVFALTIGNILPNPISVVNYDEGALGSQLKKELLSQISPAGKSPYFNNKNLDEQTAMKEYQKGKLLAVIVIPQDFTSRFENKEQPEIKFYLNNYSTDIAKNLRLYVQEGMLSFYQKYGPAKSMQIEQVFTAKEQVDWIKIIAIAVVLMAAVLGGMFSILYYFFKEKKYGTLIEYQLAPSSSISSLFARTLYAFAMSLVAAGINCTLVYLITGLNLFADFGNILLPLMLTSLFYILVAVVLAIMLSNFEGAAVISMVSVVVLWFLSGGLVSTENTTGIVKTVSYFIPNTYALSIMRGNTLGESTGYTLMNYRMLSLFAVLMLIIAVNVYNKKIWGLVEK